MSYSFSAKGDTKQLAAAAVAHQMSEVAEQQPIHKRDHDAVVNAATGLIDVLADDDTQEILVNINGYVSYVTHDEEHHIKSAHVTIGAGLQARSAPAARTAEAAGSDQGGA